MLGLHLLDGPQTSNAKTLLDACICKRLCYDDMSLCLRLDALTPKGPLQVGSAAQNRAQLFNVAVMSAYQVQKVQM